MSCIRLNKNKKHLNYYWCGAKVKYIDEKQCKKCHLRVESPEEHVFEKLKRFMFGNK